MKPASFEAQDFTIERVVSLKKERKLFVVFSTFGEREADLVFHKITLLKNNLGHLIDGILLSHRRIGQQQDQTELMAHKADPDLTIIVCNTLSVPDMEDEKGKGADMRRTLYYLNTQVDKIAPEDMVIFLDTDVVTEYFNMYFVLGLAGPLLQGYDFSKASFWRAMGRVKKYVAQPLFSLIDHPQLKSLTHLSYPLSGEVGGTMDFFNSVHFWQMYGVETGINVDASMGAYKIADVNLGLYDHEHSSDVHIQKMSFGIMRAFFLKLLQYNIISMGENAKVSDVLEFSSIGEDVTRQTYSFDLKEKMYQPLNSIL